MLRPLLRARPLAQPLIPRGFLQLRRNSTSPAKRKPKKTTIPALRRTPTPDSASDANRILSLINHNIGSHHQDLRQYLKPLISITVGESIDLDKVIGILKEEHPYPYSIIAPDEVLNIKYNDKDLMILANGSIVGWGISEQHLFDKVIPLFELAIIDKYAYESEEMDYINLNSLNVHPKDSSFMLGELVVIQNLVDQQTLLDKAAFAIGLSRSTRLSVLENALEEHILLTRSNSESLSNGEKLTSTESEVLRLTGRLFLLRGKLNLYSELIETPDLYWSEPNLEKIYDTISRTLDIQPRISILNRKLDYATEEQRALLSVLNEKKSTRLEWIIIILIMVEVGFETFHFYERYAEKRENQKTEREVLKP